MGGLMTDLPFGRNIGFRNHVRGIFEGKGLDLGPWHVPFETPMGTTETVERYSLEDLKNVFHNLPENEFNNLPTPDYVSDFDFEFLKQFTNDSRDFIIASHLLEHLAQPFKLIHDIYRVLKPGGILMIALPDKRNTFDSKRELMNLSHFIEDIKQNLTIEDINHLKDYTVNVLNLKDDDLSREVIDSILQESYHVHAFTDYSFVTILNEMQKILGFGFELVSASKSIESSARYEEFILILRKVLNKTDLVSSFREITSYD